MSDLILHAATFAAALFQSVTGVGFGMIAGPVVLIVLDDPSAVVVSALMSWLIALVLLPALWRAADRRLLGRLLAGAALGMPLGAALLGLAPIALLKLLGGLAIAALTASMLLARRAAPGVRGRPGPGGDYLASGLAGVLGAALAMPGPTAAIRLAGLGHAKATVRATMVAFFAAIWPAILLGQWASLGIGAATLDTALTLVPATLLGLAAGHVAAERFGERAFRRIVVAVLVATAASLLADALFGPFGGPA